MAFKGAVSPHFAAAAAAAWVGESGFGMRNFLGHDDDDDDAFAKKDTHKAT